MSIYIDTSALVKRYVRERSSSELEQFVAASTEQLEITALTVTEFQAVLARRLHLKDFDLAFVARTQEFFSADLQHAVWSVQPFPLQAFAGAQTLLQAPHAALATLDALHLASALALSCTAFATADKQLARAAAECGLAVHSFAL